MAAGNARGLNVLYDGHARVAFSFALRNEIKDTGVTVTDLMPGATETEFFERAHMEDTKVGQAKKDDPEMVAEIGWKAMMNGEGEVKEMMAGLGITAAGIQGVDDSVGSLLKE